jgi:hypothetical protein
VNQEFQFRTTVSVQIARGKTAATTITLPTGLLSINALPWAEVSLDGQAVGTTPLANLSVQIGRHEIVWRHPTLGERRQTVSITAQTLVRIGTDFGK